MLVLWTLLLLLTSLELDAQSKDEVIAKSAQVRQYLQQPTSRMLVTETRWLENSGNIGIGYNSIAGSPVCYSGNCQMSGFRRPVFKLNFTKQAEGYCTNKLIPQNVDLNCLSSTQISATTESISTLSQLRESMRSGIEISGSIGILDNSFTYSHSTETRSMIDTIIEKSSTVYFTRASINQISLSAFEPLLELSDQFRYVIQEMPCCNESAELDQYIKEFIIGYFGLLYINELVLGGVAQQKIVVSEENRKNLQTNGFTVTNQAELKIAAANMFSASTKLAMSEEYDKTKLDTFKTYSQQSTITTLGGSTILQSIEEWSKTISSNPAIVKFAAAPIINLLTSRRFRDDSTILMKKALIDKVLQAYVASSLFCYNNCSQKGSCQPTGYFGFGQCRCDSGWTGIDCSINARAPIGLLGGVFPDHTCSRGYRYERKGLAWSCPNSCERKMIYICTLIDENTIVGLTGTLCGIAFGSLTIPCGNLNPYSEPCPSGYALYSWGGGGYSPNILYSCQKQNTTMDDLPGTLCGYYSNVDEGNAVTCNGYHPSRGKCPPGYTYRQATYGYSGYYQGIFNVCTKD